MTAAPVSARPGRPPERLGANRDFRRLFAAQVTSLVGSGVTSVALAAFAYELTGRNATAVVGTALALRILAFVTLSPIAGVLADRVDRKRMLVVADVLRVVLLGAFPFITRVWQIYLLIFAINAVTAFFTPAFEASLPEVVGDRLYTRAVALARVAVDLESIGGPLVTRRAERAERADAGARPVAAHLRYHRWATHALVIGGALLAAALLPGILRPPYWALLLLGAVNGAGQAMIAIPSVGLLARHTASEERGRAYAAHFALTHLFWLGTYPAVGFLGRAVGVPMTFTLAGLVAGLATLAAVAAGRPHRPHELDPPA